MLIDLTIQGNEVRPYMVVVAPTGNNPTTGGTCNASVNNFVSDFELILKCVTRFGHWNSPILKQVSTH